MTEIGLLCHHRVQVLLVVYAGPRVMRLCDFDDDKAGISGLLALSSGDALFDRTWTSEIHFSDVPRAEIRAQLRSEAVKVLSTHCLLPSRFTLLSARTEINVDPFTPTFGVFPPTWQLIIASVLYGLVIVYLIVLVISAIPKQRKSQHHSLDSRSGQQE
jgi:hypothetical protein